MWERKSGGEGALRRGAGRRRGREVGKVDVSIRAGKGLRAPRAGQEVQGAVGKCWALRMHVFLLSPV